ncbi:hypothetical protein [Streptomyces sp. P17]|uniref:hypothetical protein n=1 Tax=Streptomyces sp. P17 TaxID=3074716 RepID=UPI0037DC07AF
MAERFGGPLVLLHRATLITSLAAALPPGTVRTGVTATVADPGTDPGTADRLARVNTPDGELEAELVVAADGITPPYARRCSRTTPEPGTPPYARRCSRTTPEPGTPPYARRCSRTTPEPGTPGSPPGGS